MNLKSKILCLSFVAILWAAKAENNNIAWSILDATSTTNGGIAIAPFRTGGGSIVVINDDGINYLKVTTNDGSLIISVKVYNSSDKNVASFDGCGGSECSYNISSLSKGIYKVVVETTTDEFDGDITI
jgi:hypothetical protein